MKEKNIIFSIETSCDETSVAIINNKGVILSHIVNTQEEHLKFGGVVPEIASRAHLEILQNIIPKSLKEAKIGVKDIDTYCATCGPGLIGGLLVGSTIAKSLAISNNKPFYPINHLEAHLLSPEFKFKMKFPNITFLLTGGHTQIYLIKEYHKYQLLGESIDDAIGESFDKVAKIMGLKYPGGPEIEKLAKKGDYKSVELPHPLKNEKNLNFSFSGLKTSANMFIKKQNKISKTNMEDLSASFQNKIIEILMKKLDIIFFKKKFAMKDIAIVGGVAANAAIKNSFFNFCKKNNCRLIYPPLELCGDNALMIAWTCLKKINNNFDANINFIPNPRLKIESYK